MRVEFVDKVLLPSLPPRYRYIRPPEAGMKYELVGSAFMFSRRYKKWLYVEDGMRSDGATGAVDLKLSWSWWFHDKLCKACKWSDGTPVTNWQASMTLYDTLNAEGYELRKFGWKWATFIFGGWKIKFTKACGWF